MPNFTTKSDKIISEKLPIPTAIQNKRINASTYNQLVADTSKIDKKPEQKNDKNKK